jgi:hypothetical protein
MTQPNSVTLNVNGKALTANAATIDTLLTVLRDQFLLTGAKRGCNQASAAPARFWPTAGRCARVCRSHATATTAGSTRSRA